MKTAMQEFIEDELRGDNKPMAYYLEKERENIINAFGNGEYMVYVRQRPDYNSDEYNFSNSEEYYNFTFKK